MPVGSLLGSARRRLSRAAARVGQIAIRPLDTGPSASAETARVAVVIPVFNAMPYLQQLLDSLAQQDLPPELFEVIAVDDGSTDGSGKVLERFAAAHPNVQLIRQRNSGWPGQPRNAGIEASRADYVFFADADDLLAPEALRAMLDFADHHAVDVLVPRMVGLSGRRVNHSLFAQTHVDAPLRQVFGTLSPQKLIRRELLEAHGLRFPEGRVRLEDGMLITRCYLAAQRVSVLADHDYYYLRARQDGSNISARSTVPEDYTNSVRIIARDILDRCSDPGLAEQLVLDLYRRKILRAYVPARYQAMSPRRRSRWVSAHEQFAREFVPPQLDEHLEFPFGDRSRLLRQGDPVPLLEYAKAESVLRQSCALAVPENGCPHLRFETGPEKSFESVTLLVTQRDDGRQFELALESDGQGFRLELADFETGRFGPSILDLHLQLRYEGFQGPPRRVMAPSRGLPVELGSLPLYATRSGAVSIDLRGAGPR